MTWWTVEGAVILELDAPELELRGELIGAEMIWSWILSETGDVVARCPPVEG